MSRMHKNALAVYSCSDVFMSSCGGIPTMVQVFDKNSETLETHFSFNNIQLNNI